MAMGNRRTLQFWNLFFGTFLQFEYNRLLDSSHNQENDHQTNHLHHTRAFLYSPVLDGLNSQGIIKNQQGINTSKSELQGEAQSQKDYPANHNHEQSAILRKQPSATRWGIHSAELTAHGCDLKPKKVSPSRKDCSANHNHKQSTIARKQLSATRQRIHSAELMTYQYVWNWKSKKVSPIAGQ